MVLPDGDRRYRNLEINDEGDLIFEQVDYGPVTAQLAPNGGDTDYEYWVTVKSAHINKVLLELIRDTFSDQGEFEKWLKSKSIVYNFFSY